MSSTISNIYIFGYDPMYLSRGILYEKKIISDFEISFYTKESGIRDWSNDRVRYISSIEYVNQYFVLNLYNYNFEKFEDSIKIHKDVFIRIAGLSQIYYYFKDFYYKINDIYLFFNCGDEIDCMIVYQDKKFYCSKNFLLKAYLYFKNNCTIKSSSNILSAMPARSRWSIVAKSPPILFYVVFQISRVIWTLVSVYGIQGTSCPVGNCVLRAWSIGISRVIDISRRINYYYKIIISLYKRKITPKVRSPDELVFFQINI